MNKLCYTTVRIYSKSILKLESETENIYHSSCLSRTSYRKYSIWCRV